MRTQTAGSKLNLQDLMRGYEDGVRRRTRRPRIDDKKPRLCSYSDCISAVTTSGGHVGRVSVAGEPAGAASINGPWPRAPPWQASGSAAQRGQRQIRLRCVVVVRLERDLVPM